MRFPGTFIILVELFVRVLIASNILTANLIHLSTLPFQFLGSDLVALPADMIVFPASSNSGD